MLCFYIRLEDCPELQKFQTSSLKLSKETIKDKHFPTKYTLQFVIEYLSTLCASRMPFIQAEFKVYSGKCRNKLHNEALLLYKITLVLTHKADSEDHAFVRAFFRIIINIKNTQVWELLRQKDANFLH